jgi:hypothetical protein
MAAIIAVQSNSRPVGQIFLGNGSTGIPIKLAYLGNTLVFNGQRWLWCLVSSDGLYLETSDGYKLRPKMEA